MTKKATVSRLREPERHDKYERLLAATHGLAPLATAVAHPCDESSLRGALDAAEARLIVPILVGPKDRIAGVADKFGFDIDGLEIVDVPHSQAAAETAVAAGVERLVLTHFYPECDGVDIEAEVRAAGDGNARQQGHHGDQPTAQEHARPGAEVVDQPADGGTADRLAAQQDQDVDAHHASSDTGVGAGLDQ